MDQIRKAIEQGIREHLIITNEPGVKYAVDKIIKLLPQMYTEQDMKSFYEYADTRNRGSWEDETVDQWLDQYKYNTSKQQ